MPRLLASASVIALSIGVARWWHRRPARRPALPRKSSGTPALHWPQFQAPFTGGDTADHAIRRKRQPLPPGYIGTVLTSMTFFDGIPYLEELARCLAAERRGAQGAALETAS